MSFNSRRGSRLWKGAAALVAGALLLSACSSTPPSASGGTAASGKDVKIFMAPKFTGLAYFEVARTGGEKAGKDLGFTFGYIGSDKPDATEQIATLTNAIPQSPAALVGSAVDAGALAPALKQARSPGIKGVPFGAAPPAGAPRPFGTQLPPEPAARTH